MYRILWLYIIGIWGQNVSIILEAPTVSLEAKVVCSWDAEVHGMLFGLLGAVRCSRDPGTVPGSLLRSLYRVEVSRFRVDILRGPG